jgi:DNA mismatch repair ATPase MutS
MNVSYAGGSLHFKFQSNEGTLFIDSASAKALELTDSAVGQSPACSLLRYVLVCILESASDHCVDLWSQRVFPAHFMTFFMCTRGSVLDHTWTPMGSRLLRVTLLAPITCEIAVSYDWLS